MKMIWLGSVLAAFGLAMSAHAAEPVCVERSFSCPFTNAKGESVVLQLQTSKNTATEMVIGSPAQLVDGVEPKPALCELNADVISVFVKIPVTRRGAGDKLATRHEQTVKAFELKWIPGKDSKKWRLISNDPLVAKLKAPVICTETM